MMVTEEQRAAVRRALQSVIEENKLSIASQIYGLPENRLKQFAEGDDSALHNGELLGMIEDLRR
jgi:hypothetical protein